MRVLYAEYPGKFSGRMLVIRILAALAPLLLLAWSVKLVILTHPVVFGAIPLELTLLVLLVPGLLLPSLRLAFYWNWRGDPHSVARILGSQALLCLGVLLPALVIGHAFWHGWHGGAMAITTLSPILWRLDGSLLLVAGFLLVGMRFDMLRPYHWVGMILLALYLAYLLLELTYRLA